MDKTIGTCSVCSGRVVVPDTYYSTGAPPIPRCLNCGASAANPWGPKIQMVPKGTISK